MSLQNGRMRDVNAGRVRTYAVALFCVTKPCFACRSMVLSDLSVCGFPRVARKNHTLLKIEYRSVEGWYGQLRKS